MSHPKRIEFGDYQYVPREVTAMPRDQDVGSYNMPHSHPRGQLLCAVQGLMKAQCWM